MFCDFRRDTGTREYKNYIENNTDTLILINYNVLVPGIYLLPEKHPHVSRVFFAIVMEETTENVASLGGWKTDDGFRPG